MGQESYYRNNQDYAEFLENWEPGFYAKYTRFLAPGVEGGKVLDVGCGVGQTIVTLIERGFEAHGVDVSIPNIEKAKRRCPDCQLYDGRTLPFKAESFDSVGALNVLEHVEEPEGFLAELVRVAKPGARLVVSSPNFFRVLGFRDYHPRMRGPGNKWRNWKRLQAKRRQIQQAPDDVHFDRMTPIIREPFNPDDDAVVATNGPEIAFFLERNGCRIERIDCTDRPVFRPLDFLLNLTPLRFLMFNAFVVARKPEGKMAS